VAACGGCQDIDPEGREYHGNAGLKFWSRLKFWDPWAKRQGILLWSWGPRIWAKWKWNTPKRCYEKVRRWDVSWSSFSQRDFNGRSSKNQQNEELVKTPIMKNIRTGGLLNGYYTLWIMCIYACTYITYCIHTYSTLRGYDPFRQVTSPSRSKGWVTGRALSLVLGTAPLGVSWCVSPRIAHKSKSEYMILRKMGSTSLFCIPNGVGCWPI